ncbi:hypothetical protein [Paraburkholderia youngii]|uniref:hypothetical protein n=1 Tax=Paraburkholderia youngii TaxID=2782701 RepID=UPI003D1EBF34
METMAPEAFRNDLGMLLRDVSRGVAARLTPFVVAWWDGNEVVFAFLREDDPQRLEEAFNLDDLLWDEWSAEFAGWLRAPRFDRFAEIENWIVVSPPREA